MWSLVFFTTYLALVYGIPGYKVYYVKPDNHSSCPVEQCLTLNQYVQQSNIYITTGSTFAFMAGNHSLENTVHMFNISNLTFMNEGSLSNVHVLYKNESALYCEQVENLQIDKLTFVLNSDENSSAIKTLNSEITITNSAFLGNEILSDAFGRAMHIEYTKVTITNCLFERGTGDDGGAIHASTLSAIYYLNGNTFSNNKAIFRGGAIYASGSSVSIDGDKKNHFKQNSANQGGAVYTERGCRLIIGSKHLNFTSNSAHQEGGAIYTMSMLQLLGFHQYFSYNSAPQGGAIYSMDISDRRHSFVLSNSTFYHNEAHTGAGIFLLSSSTLIIGEVTFSANLASLGGGMYILATFSVQIHLATKNLNFIGNSAKKEGGGLYVSSVTTVVIHGNFINNSAQLCGGAIYISAKQQSVDFRSINVKGNSGSAICMSYSKVTFSGTTHMANNTGYTGGAIYLKRSFLSFTGQSALLGNKAYVGGAIYSALGSTVLFQGLHDFSLNMAETDGGAIHALGTNITTTRQTTLIFANNSAQHGGAIYFNREAALTMAVQVFINTSYNHATGSGGALYYEDNTVPIQCNFTVYQDKGIELLPSCFLHLLNVYVDRLVPGTYSKFYSYHDSAGEGGSFLYGGLLDTCQMMTKNASNPNQKSLVPLVSKLLGHNPVAVLATLLLMSYTKVLKIIIEVYSSTDLDYPENKTVTVWLKDANVPYLQSKHLLLTVITTLVLIFLFLPYTILLLLGYVLYRFSVMKGFCWLNRIKPLLDSYYAPYKIHTRYWTGFLLLVRCILYIVFSVSSAQGSLRPRKQNYLFLILLLTKIRRGGRLFTIYI